MHDSHDGNDFQIFVRYFVATDDRLSFPTSLGERSRLSNAYNFFIATSNRFECFLLLIACRVVGYGILTTAFVLSFLDSRAFTK